LESFFKIPFFGVIFQKSIFGVIFQNSIFWSHFLKVDFLNLKMHDPFKISIFRGELTSVTLTWRYSQNSEIATIVIHRVASNFPEGAKVKCKCGKRTADSKRHPNIIENKVEIKVFLEFQMKKKINFFVKILEV